MIPYKPGPGYNLGSTGSSIPACYPDVGESRKDGDVRCPHFVLGRRYN